MPTIERTPRIMAKKSAKKKDPAAVSLGQKRWKGSTKAERANFASAGAKACAESMTPEERSARAKKAVEAREAKRRAAAKNA
jgi:hypothetical protein